MKCKNELHKDEAIHYCWKNYKQPENAMKTALNNVFFYLSIEISIWLYQLFFYCDVRHKLWMNVMTSQICQLLFYVYLPGWQEQTHLRKRIPKKLQHLDKLGQSSLLRIGDLCITNDLRAYELMSKMSVFIVFADDITILYSHPNHQINRINEELKQVSNHFKANKLSVNVSKTNYMILGTLHMI